MSTKSLNIFSILAALCTAVIVFSGLFVSTALAAQPTLVLTINGGQSATIIDGEEVTIQWYLNGSVNNCSLKRNGTTIRTIDTSSVPVNDSLTEVPPSGADTTYNLSCSGISDNVSVDLRPVVTLSLPQGDSRVTDPNTGVLGNVDVYWESRFATQCSNMWMVQQNPDRTYTANHSSEYRNKNQPNGWLRFRGWPHPSIDRTTTFFITCTNAINGSSETSSITLTVVDPPPPQPPIVTLWTNTPVVSPDPLYGYARADVRFNSTGVSNCYYKTYYQDGTEYPLPTGYGAWSGHTSRSFTDIRIASTTDFEVRCTRGAVTLNGTNYSATSTTSVERVVVDDQGISQDRSTLPPVTAYATATPNPATKSAITGEALISIETDVENADYCYQYAYRFNSATGQYDVRYNLNGWTLQYDHNRRGNGVRNYSAFVSESTRLEMVCRREYDYNLSNPGDPAYENGVEVTSVVVTTEEPVGVAPNPKTYLYGNAFRATAETIWSSRVGPTTFYRNNDWIQAQNDTNNQRITFPFEHPFGGSDVYNIHVEYYDENDGESTFRLLSQANGLLGSWTSNDPLSPGNNPDSTTRKVRLVASGVSLTDGDLITLECDTPNDGELCRTETVYFGAGDGGSVVVPVDEVNGFTTVPILWVSENTTNCMNAIATVPGAGSYPWYFGNSKTGIRNISIATTTEFSIMCYRSGDGLNDTDTLEVRFPQSVALEADILVASGECIDPITLQTVTAPDGFVADTDLNSGTYRQCIPAVDLAAMSPGISPIAENGVAGTHNFNVLTGIKNLGPGILPPDSGISYISKINLRPVYTTITVPDSPYASFMGGLDPNVNGGESGTLTNLLSNVPFGSHQLCTHVNEDNPAGNFPEIVGALANNQTCSDITLEIPEPTMTFQPSRKVIRSGQSVDLTWNINVGYELQCDLRGAGGLNIGFNALTQPARRSGTFPTNALTSTSEFLFECFLPNPELYFSDPSTQTTVFSQRVTVEVVPDFEEI